AKGLLVMPCSVFRLSVVWSNGRIYRPDDVKGDLAVGLRQHQASQRGTWLRTSRTTKRMHRNPLACSPCCRGNERMPDETSCRRHISATPTASSPPGCLPWASAVTTLSSSTPSGARIDAYAIWLHRSHELTVV